MNLRLKYVILLISVSSTVFLFCICVVLCYLLFLGNTEYQDDGGRYLQYKYLQFNPVNGDMNHGIAELGYNELEYKCTGKCYCDSERRYSSVVKPLFYLVAATTLSTAMYFSTDQFKDECVWKHLKDNTCPEEFIRSEIDQCEEIIPAPSVLSSNSDSDDDTKSELTKEQEERVWSGKRTMHWTYVCSGSCYPKRFDEGEVTNYPGFEDRMKKILLDNMEDIHVRLNAFGCDELRLEKEMQNPSYPASDHLKLEFAHKHLEPFCNENSVDEFDLANRWGENVWIKVNMCSAANAGGLNPTIVCVTIDTSKKGIGGL